MIKSQFYKVIIIYWICLITRVSMQRGVPLPVGAIFENQDQETEIAFLAAIEASNTNERSFELIPIIKYSKSDDPYVLEKLACELVSEGVAAIFGSPSPKSGIIAAICNNLNIPHILYEYRKELRDFEKQFHKMTISVYPNDLKLARAYASVIEAFEWTRYAIVYESEKELIQLQDVLQLHNPDSRSVVVRQLSKGPDFRPFLKDIKEMKVPCVIIHCHSKNILAIMEQAEKLNMLGEYQNFFFAPLDTHTLDFSRLNEFKANITSIRLIDPSDFNVKNAVYGWRELQRRNKLIYTTIPKEPKANLLLLNDAVLVFAKGLAGLEMNRPITVSKLNCKNSRNVWFYGKQIIESIKNSQNIQEGTTSRIDFNEDGQRNFFNIQILEYSDFKFHKIASWNAVDGLAKIETEHVVQKKRVQLISNKFFKVSSIVGPPFLFYNESLFGNNRFSGYSMDLIKEIAKIHNFSFEFVLALDGRNGNFDPDTGKWNGIIKEVMDGSADMGICDLTMTSARREVVDFTQPFMTLGISLMYAKAEETPSNLFSFVDPFSTEVWLKMCGTFVGLILVVFVAARMAPSEWINPHPCKSDPEVENTWNVKNSFWLTIGSLMGQGCDIMPKSASVRIITGTWWFFALMMLNSYTANLAAFLTTSSTVSTIKSVEELANQNKVKYGTVEGGSTQGFFRDSNNSLYQKMWSVMNSEDPTVFLRNNDAGAERVSKSKRTFAFFMESSVLEYKLERNCDLLQVGTWLDYKTYGIAMPFGSKYRKEISESILKLGENGKLTELKRKWWKEINYSGVNCTIAGAEKSTGPVALAIQNVGGVFLLLGMGILVGLVIAVLEFFWNLQVVSLEERITLKEAFKQEALFALKFWIRVKPIRTSNSNGDSMSKLSSKSLEPSSLEMKNSLTHFKSDRLHGSEASIRSIKFLNVALEREKTDDQNKPRKSSCFSLKSRLNLSRLSNNDKNQDESKL